MTKRFLSTQRIVNLTSDPVSGAAGEIYYNTALNKLKFYNGSSWQDVDTTASGGSSVTISDTPPNSPNTGDQWYESDTGLLYIYYDAFWVQIGGSDGPKTNTFATINVPTGTDPSADSDIDVLNLTSSNGMIVTGDASTDTVDFSTNATSLNTVSTIVSRDSSQSFDITAVDFDTTDTIATAVGRLTWDDGEGTLSVGLKGGNVNLQIGQENIVLCYNGTGSTIPDGTVVYIIGAQGQRPRIALAQANTEATSSKVLGVTTEDILNGAEGFVTTFGIVNGLNTSAFTAGQTLYLSPTVAGGLTATKPVAPNHMVFVAYAISIHASSGRIFVNPHNGYELDEIHDVLISDKVDRDVLIYDSVSGLWKNEPLNLTTDTVGNYVASVSTSDGISGGAAGSEGAAIALTNTDKGSSQNIFKNVAVSGQTDIVADSNNDTLTFAGGTGITITTNATTDTVTVTNAGVTGLTGTANEIEVSASTGSVTVGLPNDVTIGNNLTVTGTLTVNGTTTTVNSTTLSVDDPIITLGGDVAPIADDNKDRGIEFRYFDTVARIGFMGYDDNAGTFVFLTAATNTSEVFSGTRGTIDANGVTQAVDNNTTLLATTAFVIGQGYLKSATAASTYAPIASPTFTGTATSPLFSTSAADTAVAASHYFVETASDGIIRPKTLTNVKAEILASPTLTGTITTPLTTAGYVTTTAGGVLGSVATIPNAGLTNSSVTIGSTAVALGATVTTFAGLASVTSTTFVGALTGNASSATSATNATNTGITEDVATAVAVYPTWVTANTGNLPQKTTSTRLSFVPSTGILTATGFSGSGASLTGIPQSAVTNLTTDLSNKAATNQTFFLGTTSIAINRTSAAIALTGITSIDGSAASATTATNATNTGITEDVATAVAVYPTWVTANTGNLPQKTTSTRLSFVPSTGILTATQFSGSGAGLTSIPNGALTNSSVTVNGTAIALGASGTVTAAAGTLTGATLNATVTGSSLTSVGTITSGIWNAGAVTSSGVVQGTNVALTTGNIYRSVDTGVLNIFGGTDTLGANVELYGSTHATLPSRAYYDASLHTFRSAASATWVSIDATGVNNAITADTATAATHYFVETATDGYIRPKTLANVRTEIVTTAAVNSAAATTVGTITTGVWNAGAVTSSGAMTCVSPTATGSIGVRQTTISTAAPTGGADGDVWLVYV